MPTVPALFRLQAIALCAAVLVLLAPDSYAQTSARSSPASAESAVSGEPAPPVEQLVQRAISRYPSVAALQHRLEASREQVDPAGALPDPTIGAMYQSVGKPWEPMAPMSMGQLEYTQPLYYPGKRDARRRAASAEMKVRSAEVQDLQWAIATELRAAYARVYALDRERESLLAAADLVRTLGGAVAARYSAGQADQESFVKIDLERFRLDERIVDLRAERAALVATINRLADRDQSEPFGVVRQLPDGLAVPPNVAELALARAPSVAVRRAAIAAARDQLDAAELETKPNFLLGLSAGSTVDALPVFTARFGVELPMWKGDKQEPMIRGARQQVDAAQSELAAAEAEIRASSARLMAQWDRDNAQVQRYEQAILPQTNEALHAATASYVAGKGDFSNIIEDFRLWLDARVSLERRRAERYATWADIQALIAGSLDRRPQ